ncbi:Indoleamine 2,3-dioxygenase [Beauveria bassiana]|uniref:Indoleamine 2,3-dioxygenase n=1 Tax=Beauveria bassiana TaxID=176275 RepID=A0A2N6N8Z7_BEABA|nr:Indoleamine 2,3-dioxygenase [Beauveria bassiana]
MPARHAKFLRDVEAVANIRQYVEANIGDEGLCVAYNACLGGLGAFRDKTLQLLQDTSSALRARLKRRFW